MTLTPESWAIEKTMKKSEVSKYLVKKARSLRKELAILAEPKAKTGKVLPQETVTTVLLLRYKRKGWLICPFNGCFFTSIKEINRLRKEINRLLSKGIEIN